MTSSASKKFGVSVAYSCKTDVFIEFHYFIKKDDKILFSKPPFSKIDHPPHKRMDGLFHINGSKNLKPSNHHS